jgi:hypothetical protein
MSENKKITELNPSLPKDGYAFVAATGTENFRVSYSDLAEHSSIGVKSGSFLDSLTISGVPVSTGAGGTVGGLPVVGGDNDNIDFGGTEPGDNREINFQQGGENVMVIDQAGDINIENDLHVSGDISGDIISGKTGVFTESLSVSGHSVLTGVSMDPIFQDLEGQVKLNTISSFMFFHDLNNNTGPTFKTYYKTPTQEVFLSGVMTDSLEDIRATIRWDGPASHYMGAAYINDQKIPFSNITEIGNGARRFEGYLDNLDLKGQTVLTGSANGVTGKIPIIDLGAGPIASDITIDQIPNSTSKAGEQQGTTALKAGDQVNIFVTYDFSTYLDELQHPDTIEVKDEGLAIHTDFASYNLVDNGNGTRTATIPVTVSDRNGDLGVKVRAINNLGSTGGFQSSIDFPGTDDSRLLDQLYPTITASDPASYNGRVDGLREGESTTFTNSVSNWDSVNDTILYTASTVNNSNVSISNSNSFESPKNISYVDGIFANAANVNISTIRITNGATDSQDVTVKIANGPEITSLTISNQASSAAAPNIIGASEIKGGDVIEVLASIDTQGESPNSIQIRVFDEGISNGASFSSYSSSLVAGDVYEYIIPIAVTSNVGRNGLQSIKIEARNQYGTLSDDKISSNQTTVNQTAPFVSISSVSYPSSQQAIKNSESATVSNSVTSEDSVLYKSPSVGGNTQLDVSNPTVNESSKIVDYQAGGYNITSNNFKITATKTSNGAVTVAETTVNIANDPLQLSITSLASLLESSPNGISDNFNLNSDQKFLSIPALSTDPSQSPASQLTSSSSGTNEQSNKYIINVKDVDQKGAFNWAIDAQNLAGITTTNILTNSNYTLEGFSARTVASNPSTALGRGLFSVGTTVSNPNNVVFENIAEGGSGPNGGTIYSYKSFPAGTQLVDSMDFNNQFTVCDSAGVTSVNGDFCYNLDKGVRDGNSSTQFPAQADIKEE